MNNQTTDLYRESIEYLADRILQDEESAYHSELESFKQYSERKKLQIIQKLEELHESYNNGYLTLMGEIDDRGIDDVEKYLITDGKKEILKNKSYIDSERKKGKTYQDFLGYTDDMMLKLYAIGVEFYNNDRNDQSRDIFTFLTTINPNISTFWVCLGCALEVARNFEDAFCAYQNAIETNSESIDPYIHAARCCLAQNDTNQAHKIIESAIQKAEESSNHDFSKVLKEEAEKILEYIGDKYQ